MFIYCWIPFLQNDFFDCRLTKRVLPIVWFEYHFAVAVDAVVAVAAAIAVASTVSAKTKTNLQYEFGLKTDYAFFSRRSVKDFNSLPEGDVLTLSFVLIFENANIASGKLGGVAGVLHGVICGKKKKKIKFK